MRNSMIELATERLKDGLETARRMGAQGSSLTYHQGERIGCEFESGRLKSVDTRQSVSFHVEVLLDGRRAVASGNELTDLDEIISRAVALAKAGSAAHFDAYPVPGEVVAVKTYSQRTVDLTRDTMISTCQSMVDRLKEYDPDMFICASAGRNESESLLVTSGGVCYPTTNTGWSLNSYCQRTEGTDMLFTGYGRGGVDLDEQWNPDWIVERTLEDLRYGEKLSDPPTGKTKALLLPQGLGTLLRALEMGVSGRNVAKGDSPLRGRIGEKMFDESLTIVDDPHSDFCSGAQPIDDCGVPTRVIPIVTAGVLKNFLYDLDSAGLAGAEPTGNDGCQPHSLTVSPGSAPSEELLEGIDDGLVIKGVIGFGQGNLINGDFSCNVGLGFRVRGGKIVGRVKDTMVAGNVYDLLASSLQLSSDVDPVHRMPYALIDGLSVSAG